MALLADGTAAGETSMATVTATKPPLALTWSSSREGLDLGKGQSSIWIWAARR
jgi:hypothetical protein